MCGPGVWSVRLMLIAGVMTVIQISTASSHKPGLPIPKVPHDLLQTVDAVGDSLRGFETRVHRQLPRVVESLRGKLLLAFEMPVDSALFQTGGLHQVG